MDNTLAQHHLRGVVRSGRGFSRRISRDAVLELAIARTLVRELELPLARALRIAGEAARNGASGAAGAAGASGAVTLGDFVAFSIDVPALRRWLDERLRLAVELMPPSRRGRPPGRRAYS